MDKATGKTQWKTARDSRNSYASPAVMPIGTSDQIVCSSQGSVDGYDPITGKLLWSFDDVGGNNVATPFQVVPGQFLISGRPGMHNEREKEAKRSNLLMTVELGPNGAFVPKVNWRVPTTPSLREPYQPPRRRLLGEQCRHRHGLRYEIGQAVLRGTNSADMLGRTFGFWRPRLLLW